MKLSAFRKQPRQTSSEYQESLYYVLGLFVFIYCLYLLDVRTHLQTLKKLFNLETQK